MNRQTLSKIALAIAVLGALGGVQVAIDDVDPGEFKMGDGALDDWQTKDDPGLDADPMSLIPIVILCVLASLTVSYPKRVDDDQETDTS